jgi:hypothetical protein
MTERERWIVYPLLFLALGSSLRDKLIDRTTSRVIVCQELQVVDEDITGLRPTRTLARIGHSGSTAEAGPRGVLELNGGVLVVDGDDLSIDRPPRSLIELGRIPATDETPSSGYLLVDGEANIDGQLVVQNVRIVPSLQNMLRELQALLGGLRQPASPRRPPTD